MTNVEDIYLRFLAIVILLAGTVIVGLVLKLLGLVLIRLLWPEFT